MIFRTNVVFTVLLQEKIFKEVCHQLRCFYSKHDSIQEYLKKHPISLDDLLLHAMQMVEPARL